MKRHSIAASLALANLRLAVTIAMTVCFVLGASTASSASPDPRLGPDIVTVHGTAIFDFADTVALSMIGFVADPAGYLEFEISYELSSESLSYSPGNFVVMSFDADGNVIDIFDASPTTVEVAVGKTLSPLEPQDYYTAQVGAVANNVKFLCGLFLTDRINRDVLPSDPEYYLNDFRLWPEHEFGFGVDTDGIGVYYTSLVAIVSSLSARIEHNDIIATLEAIVSALPDSAFDSAAGHRTALLKRLAAIRVNVLNGDAATAIEQLNNLRRRVDGCGAITDRDDWLIDCAAQIKVRASIDRMITFLGG